MKKISIQSFLPMSLFFFLVACSSDALQPNGSEGSSSNQSSSSSVGDPTQHSSSSNQEVPPSFGEEITGARSVRYETDLPECTKELEGQLYYLTSRRYLMLCGQDGFAQLDLTGEPGVNGIDGVQGQAGYSCDVTDNKNGTYTLECENGNSITLTDGEDGLPSGPGLPGGSCSVADNEDGSFELSCEGGNSFTLYDGTDGVKGEQGETGAQGSSLVWLGSFATAPSSPNLNEAFYWNTKGISCIWTGSSWEIFSRDGGVTENCPSTPGLATFIDSRDSTVYKMTTIGDQTWMAENLNYDAGAGSSCYENLESNCEIYGRHYTWSVAMKGYKGQTESTLKGVKGICPTGWHIPSHKEWQALQVFVSSENKGSSPAHFLKAESDLWKINTGHDIYGFSALPAGLGQPDDNNHVSTNATFLSTLDLDDGFINHTYMSYNSGDFSSGTGRYKETPASLRCVKD